MDGEEAIVAGETEKITMNLGPVDLGQIALKVNF